MAFDGIVIKSVVNELSNKLIDGRIDKIYQPEKDELFIHIRAKGENKVLLLSASSNNPRIYLTSHSKKNPVEPPMFCMILRKHLIGSTILNIEQYKTDRIIYIDMMSKDELGINREKRLIIEIMGRHSNIILIDKESKKIIDSIGRVSTDMSSVRQIFPGIEYNLPPLQDKLYPLDVCRESFDNAILKSDDDITLFKFLYMNYLGLSPIFSKQIIKNSNLDVNLTKLVASKNDLNILFIKFKESMQDISKNIFYPNIIYDDKKILGFHVIPLTLFKNKTIIKYSSISKLLDNLYFEKDLYDRISQKSQSLRKIITNNIDRAKKKLKKQKSELDDAKNREIYIIYADLISANIYNIEKGAKVIKLQNFYDPELNFLEIPLDEKLPAHMNAQKYYKKYSRLKNAENLLSIEIPNTSRELEYLENVYYSILNAEEVKDLEEIKEELIDESYIKKSKKSKKAKNIESAPHHFVTTNGIDIFIGKNNRQNDELTFKHSTRDDIWLHVQNMPGSHVILKTNGQKYEQRDLEEAAQLAAYYSSAKSNKVVSVDYTERKHVKKQKGAKAGLVFYEDFNTIIVKPTNIR